MDSIQDDIMSHVTQVFRDVFNRPDMVVTEGTTSRDVPGWDSLKNVYLFVEAESAFGIKFSIAEIDSLRNVGDLVRLIAAKR
jgi:acyl carrier protein